MKKITLNKKEKEYLDLHYYNFNVVVDQDLIEWSKEYNEYDSWKKASVSLNELTITI